MLFTSLASTVDRICCGFIVKEMTRGGVCRSAMGNKVFFVVVIFFLNKKATN